VDPNSDAETYVARLRDRLPCKVLNAGFPNDRAADLLDRLERDVLSLKPTAVIVFIGGNDYINGTPRKEFAKTLEAIAAGIAEAGARMLIVEVPAGVVWNPYAGIYRKVAARYRATLIPESQLRLLFTVEMLARERLTTPYTLDGIHLSPKGATTVANWLEPYAREIIFD
jgi:lysophospholipase L1-like esterase